MSAHDERGSLRIGVLETGGIVTNAVLAAAREDDAEMIRIGSRWSSRAGAYALQHGIPRFGPYEDVPADDDVDLVERDGVSARPSFSTPPLDPKEKSS